MRRREGDANRPYSPAGRVRSDVISSRHRVGTIMSPIHVGMAWLAPSHEWTTLLDALATDHVC